MVSNNEQTQEEKKNTLYKHEWIKQMKRGLM